MLRAGLLLLVTLAAPLLAAAQTQQPRITVVSPEVHPDRRVTLRLLAPRAEEVVVVGEITDAWTPTPMTRGADGVWSVTLGPLAPDLYSYAFRVNRVNTPDPVNPYLKTVAGFGLSSQVEVPGDGLAYYDMKPVPHGLVNIVPYWSRSLGVQRAAWVYTPPGYSAGSAERYPVLYLLHGGGDTENGWVTVGRANFILDNLIAEGRARPMVVVMPLVHPRQAVGVAPEAAPAGNAGFEDDLVRDLMPLVERTFRVSSNPDDRAIMGLALGGAVALDLALDDLDLFRSVAALSTGAGDDPRARFAGALAAPADVNSKLRLLHLTIGDDEAGFQSARHLSTLLQDAGIRHTFAPTDGALGWRVWRRNLYEIAPLLFR